MRLIGLLQLKNQIAGSKDRRLTLLQYSSDFTNLVQGVPYIELNLCIGVPNLIVPALNSNNANDYRGQQRDTEMYLSCHLVVVHIFGAWI